jgi:glycosyltransferase involved in cell wall biosynthesis
MKRKLNVLHISTYDGGGAGRAAYNLHRNMVQNDVNSVMLVSHKSALDSNIIEYEVSLYEAFKNRFRHLFRTDIKSDADYCFFNYSEKRTHVSVKRILKQIRFRPDIIILHWISRFISSKDVFELNKKTGCRIFWYGMDMAPLTGGCHYAWNCTGYINRCGSCPAIYSSNPTDRTFQNLQIKLHYITNSNVSYVACNSFTAIQAMHSSLFSEREIEKIFLSVNPQVFNPTDKSALRKKLKIEEDRFIILVGASNINERRKGWNYLYEAFKIFAASLKEEERQKILILSIGETVEMNKFPFELKQLGYLKGDEALASAYQAADIFVCPSVEDSGPMMINESIMTGTPVVAFNMGVAGDLVLNNKTGYLATLKDSADLAQGMHKIFLLPKNEYARMSSNCRELGLKLLHPEVQLNGFISLFNQ